METITITATPLSPDTEIFVVTGGDGQWIERVLGNMSAGEYVRTQKSEGRTDEQDIQALCDNFGFWPQGSYASKQDAQDDIDAGEYPSYYSIESFTCAEAHRRILEMAAEEAQYDEDES